MKTYSEKLQHPSWQKKRLEILNRDNFKCRSCGSAEKMLHVHHLLYRKDADPWEYPNTSLITLCVDCHEYEHQEYSNSKSCLINSFREFGATQSDLIFIAVCMDEAGCNEKQFDENDWSSFARIIEYSLRIRNKTGTLTGLKEFLFNTVVEVENMEVENNA